MTKERLTPAQLQEKLSGMLKEAEEKGEDHVDFMTALTTEIYGIMEKYLPAMQTELEKAKAEGRANDETTINDAILRFIPGPCMVALVAVLSNELDIQKAHSAATQGFLNVIMKNSRQANPHHKERHAVPPQSNTPPNAKLH